MTAATDRTDRATRRRQSLTEELDFLLASIEDLDAEHAAGDLSALDHSTLVDDYTRRAADVRRRLDDLDRPDSAAGSKPSRSTLMMAAGSLVLAVLAGVGVAQTAGNRGVGDTSSGGVRESARSLVADAHAAEAAQDLDSAIAAYDAALELMPSDVEALTYRGWNRFLTDDVDGARADLDEAILVDEDYPDARAFRAVLASRRGDPEAVLTELDVLEAGDPPPGILQLVEEARLRDRAIADLALIDAREALAAGDALGALEAYSAVLEVEPTNYEALTTRAWIGAQPGLDDPETHADLLANADELLTAAIESEPEVPRAFGLRAIILEAAGDPDGAARDLAAFDEFDGAASDVALLVEQSGIRERLPL